MSNQPMWYSAKCIIKHLDLLEPGDVHYEERVVLLWADSLDHAIERGEEEAAEYVASIGDAEYAGFVSVFRIGEEPIGDRCEVYSLMRKTSMETDDFLDRYHDDGTECTQVWEDGKLGKRTVGQAGVEEPE